MGCFLLVIGLFIAALLAQKNQEEGDGDVMLLIKCKSCSKQFWVKGHTTPGSFDEPGEVILKDCDPPDDACTCWLEGSSFDVVSEETEDFED